MEEIRWFGLPKFRISRYNRTTEKCKKLSLKKKQRTVKNKMYERKWEGKDVSGITF